MGIRKGDIKLIIEQDNDQKSLLIKNADYSLQDANEYFSYNIGEIVDRDFRTFLTSETKEILDDYIEFDYQGRDLKDVSERIIKFELVDKHKKKSDMKLIVQRELSSMEKQVFSVIMEKKTGFVERIKALISSLADTQIFDEDTGLLNSESFCNTSEIIKSYYLDNTHIPIYLAVFNFTMIIGKEDSSLSQREAALKEVGLIFDMNFRSTDITGYLGRGDFAVLFTNIDPTMLSEPVKRLNQKLVAYHNTLDRYEPIYIDAKFLKFDPKKNIEELINSCKNREANFQLKIGE
jgi:GGDEF domain-containing protein